MIAEANGIVDPGNADTGNDPGLPAAAARAARRRRSDAGAAGPTGPRSPLSARAYSAVPVVAADRPLPAQWADRLVDVRVDTERRRACLRRRCRFRDPYHQLLAGTGIGIGTPLTVSRGHGGDRGGRCACSPAR